MLDKFLAILLLVILAALLAYHIHGLYFDSLLVPSRSGSAGKFHRGPGLLSVVGILLLLGKPALELVYINFGRQKKSRKKSERHNRVLFVLGLVFLSISLVWNNLIETSI